MPQMQLPIFPEGVTEISEKVAFKKEKGQVMYFNGHLPIFIHPEDDIASFRMITSQFCVYGNAKQAEIVKAFGVPAISVKRAVKLYREKGPKGFFEPRNKRKGTVLTKPVLAKVQTLLDEGHSVAEIAKELEIKNDTIKKAIQDGRLVKTSENTVKKNFTR